MDRQDLFRMFAYDDWANRECLRALRVGGVARVADAAAGLGSAARRMGHILSAEKLWLERIQRVPQSLAVWPASAIEECDTLAEEIAAEWKDYLAGLSAGGLLSDGGLDEKVEYKNSKGELWSSRAGDVLKHVLMHSAYHRGQIALEMRAAGMEPAYTDFIHAVRQGLVT
jgi:uncharacterized damage-inducible protein DinB